MHGRKISNNLIVIENGQLTNYCLDDKLCWQVGRLSKGNSPDIILHSVTASRKHGKFQNMDGVWFYIDNSSNTNGTIYNNKKVKTGLNGRVKPIMVSDGDIFIFGGGEEAIINAQTIWALFSTRAFDKKWRCVDTKGLTQLSILSAKKVEQLKDLKKGDVIERVDGIVIYMEDITYLIGDIDIVKK